MVAKSSGIGGKTRYGGLVREDCHTESVNKWFSRIMIGDDFNPWWLGYGKFLVSSCPYGDYL